MKKNILILAAMLIALAMSFASCGSSDDDVNNGGSTPDDTPSKFEGSGTLVMGGKTYEVAYCEITHHISWGGAPGTFIIFPMVPEVVGGEQWYSSPIHIILADDHLNATYDLTKNLNSYDGKIETEIGIDGYAYEAGTSYFKSGTILVKLDEAAGTVTIETQGVVKSKEENKDIEFSLTFTGQGNVFNYYLAKEPDVPFGNGEFNGTCSLKLDGIELDMSNKATVSYMWGRTGEYTIYFYENPDYMISEVHIPLDHVGATYNLTKDLSGPYKESTSISFQQPDYVYYDTAYGDFKSGTILVSIDPAGNLTVDIEGVGNMKEDPSDSDKTIELHYTGKGTVRK